MVLPIVTYRSGAPLLKMAHNVLFTMADVDAYTVDHNGEVDLGRLEGALAKRGLRDVSFAIGGVGGTMGVGVCSQKKGRAMATKLAVALALSFDTTPPLVASIRASYPGFIEFRDGIPSHFRRAYLAARRGRGDEAALPGESRRAPRTPPVPESEGEREQPARDDEAIKPPPWALLGLSRPPPKDIRQMVSGALTASALDHLAPKGGWAPRDRMVCEVSGVEIEVEEDEGGVVAAMPTEEDEVEEDDSWGAWKASDIDSARVKKGGKAVVGDTAAPGDGAPPKSGGDGKGGKGSGRGLPPAKPT